MTKFFCTIVVLVFMQVYSNAQSKNTVNKLNNLFKELEVKEDFNGNIVVAKGNQIVYHKSIGFADFNNKIPNSKETVFELASMGKQFTAMAIMMLKENGKLSFEDKVEKHIPNFPYTLITIRDLLTMSSGIPDYLNFSESWDVNVVVTNNSVVEYYNKVQPELEFKPGEKFNYSNVNYVFLAEIVKNVSGETFSDFLKENIFDPLKMSSTRSYNTRFLNDETIPNYAYPYIKKNDNYIKADENLSTKYVIAASGIEGDGSIVSTTEDLIKWTNAVKEGELVSLDLVEEAYSKSILDNGKENEYGYGMYIGKNKRWHWGGWPGVQTSYTYYLKNNVTVIYLKNLESNNWIWINELERILKKL